MQWIDGTDRGRSHGHYHGPNVAALYSFFKKLSNLNPPARRRKQP